MIKNKRKFITFLPLDTPHHILMNFSTPLPVWIGLYFCLLLFALFAAYLAQHVFPFICVFFGLGLGVLWWLHRPPNLFSIGEIWGKRFELDQLEESALRVLTFFKSKEAQKIVFFLSGVLVFCTVLSWYIFSKFLPQRSPVNTETLLCISLLSIFASVIATFAHYVVILSWYTLRNWDKIQRNYAPWPVNHPYEVSLRDRWKNFWASRKSK